jgi:hypothetical protein
MGATLSGDGRDELAGVVVTRIVEDVCDVALFDDVTGPHDGDTVTDLTDDRQIVGDEQIPDAVVALQIGEQCQDLRLHGDVERGHRFVQNQQARRVASARAIATR